jgi:uncharacterized protein YkwD
VRRLRALPIVLVTLWTACTLPVGEPVPPRPVPAPATDNVLALVARDVIAEVNRVRTSRGLAPLVVDTALNRAAREHAAELAERRILDHSSVDPARRTLPCPGR